MSVVCLSSYKTEKRVVSVGDKIKWHDPIFDEDYVGIVREIYTGFGFSRKTKEKVDVKEDLDFWFLLDDSQSISGDLFIEKVTG